jgi:hypothetical protein
MSQVENYAEMRSESLVWFKKDGYYFVKANLQLVTQVNFFRCIRKSHIILFIRYLQE